MIGRTIIRWLAAKGRPAALAQREAAAATTSTTSTSNDTVVPNGGNWFTRTIQRNRVLTASGIAVVLFTYGGFAWSARPSTRLVRKQTDPIPDINKDFGELLNLPPYKRQDEQLAASQDAASIPSTKADRPTTTDAFDPFQETPQLDVPDGDHLQFSDVHDTPGFETTQPILALPTAHQPSQPNTQSAPSVSFPSLGLPDFPAPQLDNTSDQAEPLRDSSNPFQSQ